VRTIPVLPRSCAAGLLRAVVQRLGAREGDWVEVLDGLTSGQRVVSRGAYLVKLASTGTAQIGHGHAH